MIYCIFLVIDIYHDDERSWLPLRSVFWLKFSSSTDADGGIGLVEQWGIGGTKDDDDRDFAQTRELNRNLRTFMTGTFPLSPTLPHEHTQPNTHTLIIQFILLIGRSAVRDENYFL